MPIEINDRCMQTTPCKHGIRYPYWPSDCWRVMSGDRIARMIQPDHPKYEHFAKYLTEEWKNRGLTTGQHNGNFN